MLESEPVKKHFETQQQNEKLLNYITIINPKTNIECYE